MKNTALGIIQDFVMGNLPDVAVPSSLRMDPELYRSIGTLSERPRPLRFVDSQLNSRGASTTREVFEKVFAPDECDSPPDPTCFNQQIKQVCNTANQQRVIERIFWEAVYAECPRALDYFSEVCVTSDWQIVVARLAQEPRHVLFSDSSLPADFFKIICEVLSGGIHWDGQITLAPKPRGLDVAGEITDIFIQQIFIHHFKLARLKEKSEEDFFRGRWIEQFAEETTVGEYWRFQKRQKRINEQIDVLMFLVSEYLESRWPGHARIEIYRDWQVVVRD